jgi:hypothetical protein
MSGQSFPHRRSLLGVRSSSRCVLDSRRLPYQRNVGISPWNSLFIVHLSFKDFRTHLRKPAFVAFLIAWGVVHGVVVVAMMRRIPVVLWIFVISFELLIADVLADYIFAIRRSPKETTE